MNEKLRELVVELYEKLLAAQKDLHLEKLQRSSPIKLAVCQARVELLESLQAISAAERPQLSAEHSNSPSEMQMGSITSRSLELIVDRAKTKTPCASNYECLVADLMGLLTGVAEPRWKNAVCFTCEGESGLPPSKTVDICEKCYGGPDTEYELAAAPAAPPVPQARDNQICNIVKELFYMLDWSVDSLEAQHLIHTLTQFVREAEHEIAKYIAANLYEGLYTPEIERVMENRNAPKV